MPRLSAVGISGIHAGEDVKENIAYSAESANKIRLHSSFARKHLVSLYGYAMVAIYCNFCFHLKLLTRLRAGVRTHGRLSNSVVVVQVYNCNYTAFKPEIKPELAECFT